MILNIYKPPGLTSHDVVNQIRRITGERRVGHAGTLDPFAEGVLVVGVGREATKQLGAISKNTDKEYVATLELGKTSTTGDAHGTIESRIKNQELRVAENEIRNALGKFVGEIRQTPPAYSAVKVRGEPAYKRARRGEKVNLPSRKVRIFELETLDYRPPFLKIKAVCSSGTYIRSLAENIGRELGVGAYLVKLVRTRVGRYRVGEAMNTNELRIKN